MMHLVSFLMTQNISTTKSFFNKINELTSIKSRKQDTQKRKIIVNDAASKLFNEQMVKLDDKYNESLNAEKNQFCSGYNISDLFLSDYYYLFFSDVFVPPRRGYEKVPPMPQLADDEEEVKEGKGLKILTPNKLLTRLPLLVAQTKGGNNSCKLRTDIRQIFYLLYQHNKNIKKPYKNYNNGSAYWRR